MFQICLKLKISLNYLVGGWVGDTLGSDVTLHLAGVFVVV